MEQLGPKLYSSCPIFTHSSSSGVTLDWHQCNKGQDMILHHFKGRSEGLDTGGLSSHLALLYQYRDCGILPIKEQDF